MCLLILVVAAACSNDNRYPQLTPVDETNSDKSFASFRQRLEQACALRDSTFLLQHVASDVMVGFGAEGKGVNAFREHWSPHDSQSAVWTVLPELLQRGCVRDSSDEGIEFVCPYTYAEFPDSLDPSTHVVLWESGVPVRTEAILSADTVSVLDYAILEIRGWEPAGWVKVGLSGEHGTGYVREEECYFSHGARAGFTGKGDKWLLRYLIAGE